MVAEIGAPFYRECMIDLHTHTYCSDGTDSPAQLMDAAASQGLSAVGVTDHDTIEGWAEAAGAVERTGVRLVRGMEMTTKFFDESQSASVHMLAYLFDPDSPALAEHRRKMVSTRENRAREIVDRLTADFPISWDDVVAVMEPGASVGRPHIADALVKRGIIPDRSSAFTDLLSPRNKYYVPQYAPNSLEAIEWICDAGGKAVFAHPLAETRGTVIPLEAVDEMAEAGLFGIEVHHRDNPPQRRDEISATAERLGLFQFGSSDYHGEGKPNRLAEHTTAPATFDALAHGAFLEVLNP